MVRVNVKWGKQQFENVELHTAQPVAAFKATLQAMTGVPAERQKLMGKKLWRGMLRDSEDLSALSIADGAQVMLMGTAELPVAPVQQVQFVEDMTEAEAAAQGVLLPAGLNNLGNTCYMNSVLQCLRTVPELREALVQWRPAEGAGPSIESAWTAALRSTFETMDNTAGAYTPTEFVGILRQGFPQFAEQGPNGAWKQQDSDEFASTLLGALAQQLTQPVVVPSLGPTNNMIDALFGLQMEETLTCAELEGAAPQSRSEPARKLSVAIQGGAGSDVQINHMEAGIMLGLEGTVEKNCPELGRDAVYNIQRRIDRLPRYIVVQFVRFFWRNTPNSRDHEGVPCKTMRKVTFADTFDAFQFCTDRLKAVLAPARDAESQAMMASAPAGASASAGVEPAAPLPDVEMAELDDEEKAELEAARALSLGAGAEESKAPEQTEGAAGVGLPAGFKGMYELRGVVTHKGRSSSSGHYVGWTKGQEPEQWFCFDDEEVSECRWSDVALLSGGGDRETCYICLYAMKE